VRERDLGSTVAEAQERVAKNVPLPPGYRMEWSGEFGALQDAKKRLAVIVPLSLLLILALLYSLFNSLRDSFIALSGIPFAVCGGVLGLYVAGLNASVSAAVGFISLFGVAAMMASCWCPTSAATWTRAWAPRRRSSRPARRVCARCS